MGKIFCIIGKMASGKDVVCSTLLEQKKKLKKLVSYTTRAPLNDEVDGIHYYFVTDEYIAKKEKEGKLIEKTILNTENGLETYATIDDEQVAFTNGSYIAIKDPAGAQKIRDFYGKDKVIIIHITVDDGIRLMRALTREMTHPYPQYAEMCNRYLNEELEFANIQCDFVCQNADLFKCVDEVMRIIKENRK